MRFASLVLETAAARSGPRHHHASQRARGCPRSRGFTAVYVKKAAGRWLQAAVRDEVSGGLTPHERLAELEWLVGDRMNESQDAMVVTTCKWADGGNFLIREFTMKTKGQPVLSGSQRIGWDPLRRQFKTWIFDSEGGHGEGFWTHNGDQWVIKVDGVGQDGLPFVGHEHRHERLGKDRFSWESVDRTLGGSAIPGIDAFVVKVRRPRRGSKLPRLLFRRTRAAPANDPGLKFAR